MTRNITANAAGNPVGSIQASPSTLAKATGGALLAAAAIVVLFVMPAEYGIDPTGVGEMTGIIGMGAGGEASAAPAEALVASTAALAMPTKASIIREGKMRSDEMTLTLEPHSGQEVKAHMTAGGSYVFEWSTKGGPVKVDMHGEKTNAAEGEFTSYWKDSDAAGGHGAFEAPFDGTHGWYWQNLTPEPVTVRLKTSGHYLSIGRPKP